VVKVRAEVVHDPDWKEDVKSELLRLSEWLESEEEVALTLKISRFGPPIWNA
jgi:hypothetical protein